MPVFGTGGGSDWHSAGKVIAQMFPLVQAAAIENDVDVVICALEAAVYAALQVRTVGCRSFGPVETNIQ